MKPLWFMEANQVGVVKKIYGGKKIRQRLTGMGFAEGITIKMIKNDNCGPLIIGLGEGRIVLGQGVANKIMVDEYS